MKKYVIEFFRRALIFGGLGPIVLGIILYIISKTTDITFSGEEVLLGIISTYLLAFIQAGTSVFQTIENWSVAKSSAIHLFTLYFAYLGCYLVNSWIPFDWSFVLIFTIIFVAMYFVIWFIVYIIIKTTTKQLNSKL